MCQAMGLTSVKEGGEIEMILKSNRRVFKYEGSDLLRELLTKKHL